MYINLEYYRRVTESDPDSTYVDVLLNIVRDNSGMTTRISAVSIAADNTRNRKFGNFIIKL